MLFLVLGAIALVVLLELLLRLLGYTTSAEPSVQMHPNMKSADELLGWRSPVGRHVFLPYSPSVDTIMITVGQDGKRPTAPQPQGDTACHQVSLLGSFDTFGWAVSDQDTYAWKLQERLSTVKIDNFSVPGHTTYQSLLLLEEQINSSDLGIVLYEFEKYSPMRNRGAEAFIKLIYRFYDGGGRTMPYVEKGEDGKLQRFSPDEFRMPFTKQSALVNLMYRKYLGWFPPGRHVTEDNEVMELLYQEIVAVTKAHDAQFVVLFLIADEANLAQQAILDRLGISYIDCSQDVSDEFRVPGYKAPNGKIHTAWADCIASKIQDFLPEGEKDCLEGTADL